jgi:mono/diheme cytochrome c family protein
MLHVKKLIASGIIVLTIVGYACTQTGAKDKPSNENATKPVLEKKDLVARGEFLMTVGGCNDCHTPKLFDQNGMHLDSSRLYSGHPAGSPLPPVNPDALKPGQWYQMAPDITAFVGPWGISYAANLTPDSTTGIGAWSEETFIKTLRTGKHLGMENGRPILPPMPWYNLANLSDDDFHAIYAYLRSLPPIVNRVPGPVPPNEVVLK